ncbi:hypothetical protein [Paraflavitalea pollutisoli]|uniref:hypothetical protein n=1 Tax=Paraflavitalea pollutisoli TaxID=3034143 RepID=UPI0023ECF7F2|nr:hypothetical protein [Paraflavitalea sp. H1-2-19X]
MKKILLIIFTLMVCSVTLAQRDSSLFKRIAVDTAGLLMNMDAVYSRPAVQIGKIPVNVGGYVELNSAYVSRDGIAEGLSFQIPRLTLFISSSIRDRIKFLTEIEFEEGGKEISIEFASVDIELHPLLNIRGGIVMNPIGSFNQNHDGPKWEFIDRPLSATTIIPATWSNVGAGIYGKLAKGDWVWAYELYATNGFDDKIINNSQNRTWMPASKDNRERFTESFNGVPLITGKTAIRNVGLGELGISWMGGVYNMFRSEGIKLDKKRSVDFVALDYNTKIPFIKTYINAEWVWAFVDIPDTYTEQFGNRQQGGFIDIVQPLVKKRLLGWNGASINLAVRAEYADYNVGYFRQAGGRIYDEVVAVVPGISFRPSGQTVFRINYRREWQRDLLGNPPAKLAAIQIGLSTYF